MALKATNVQFNGAMPGGHGRGSFDVVVPNAYLAPPLALRGGNWVVVYDNAHELFEGEVLSIKPSVVSGVHRLSVEVGGMMAVADKRKDLCKTWVHRGSEGWVRAPGIAEIGTFTTDNGVIDLRVPLGSTESFLASTNTNCLRAQFTLDQGLSDDTISFYRADTTYDVTNESGDIWYWNIWTAPGPFAGFTAIRSATTGSSGNSAEDGSMYSVPAGTKSFMVQLWCNAASHTVAAEKFVTFKAFDIFGSSSTSKYRIDQAMVDLATRPGVAFSYVSQPVGQMMDDLRVGSSTNRVSVAGGLEELAGYHAQPFEWGFWDNRTFYVNPQLWTPDNDSRVIVVGKGRPGLVEWSVANYDEEVPDYACVLFGNKDSASYPEGWPRRIFRPTTPPDDNVKLETVDYSGTILTDASAAAIADNLVGRAPATIPGDYVFRVHPERAKSGLWPGNNVDPTSVYQDISDYRAVGTVNVANVRTTGPCVVTVDGTYTVLKFTGSGSLIIPAGLSVPAEVLVVGGGGGGGSRFGGGGGGGGYLTGVETLTGTMTVTVGAGGSGGSATGGPGTAGATGGGAGGDSVFGTRTAKGGGGGAPGDTGNGAAGGSGGGAAGRFAGTGGDHTGSPASQGNHGGSSSGQSPYRGSGGGGAAADGGAGGTTVPNGAGGAGLSSDIVLRGSNVDYAGGGGGGGSSDGNTNGGGATHGGGAGGGYVANTPAATAGTANTGGGGGGGAYAGSNQPGAAGATGVVVVRFLTSALSYTALSGWSGTNSPADPTCLSFDGVDDYVTFGNLAQLNLGIGARSISAWVKFASLPAAGGVAALCGKRIESGAYTGWLLYWAKDAAVLYFVVESGGVYRQVYYTFTPTLGVWYHVLAAYDGNEAYLYVNGVVAVTGRAGAAGAYNMDNTNHFALGCGQPDVAPVCMLNGSLGEVIVYPRALSAGDAATLYAAGQCLYDRSAMKGTVVIEGEVQNRKGATVPAEHVRAGWWIQHTELATQPIYISGHSVSLNDHRNALTVGEDWMEDQIGVREAELLAIAPTPAPEDVVPPEETPPPEEPNPVDPGYDDPGTDPGGTPAAVPASLTERDWNGLNPAARRRSRKVNRLDHPR